MSAQTNITSLAPARSAEFIFTGPEVLSARPAKRAVSVQPLSMQPLSRRPAGGR